MYRVAHCRDLRQGAHIKSCIGSKSKPTGVNMADLVSPAPQSRKAYYPITWAVYY